MIRPKRRMLERSTRQTGSRPTHLVIVCGLSPQDEHTGEEPPAPSAGPPHRRCATASGNPLLYIAGPFNARDHASTCARSEGPGRIRVRARDGPEAALCIGSRSRALASTSMRTRPRNTCADLRAGPSRAGERPAADYLRLADLSVACTVHRGSPPMPAGHVRRSCSTPPGCSSHTTRPAAVV